MTPTEPPRIRFDLTNRWRIFAGLGILVAIIIVFIAARTTHFLNFEDLQLAMDEFATGPWALPLLMVVFCIAAVVGVPQFALIAMSVALFGPWLGAFFSWGATMASGAMTFWLGRFTGEKAFRRYAGATANKLSGFIGRNAMIASAVVRNVPTGPFLIVNMAFGVSHARFSRFMAGMAVGIIPKIALIAFAGQSLFAAIKGNPLVAIAAAGAAIGIYVIVAVYVRHRMRAESGGVPLIPESVVDTDENRAK